MNWVFLVKGVEIEIYSEKVVKMDERVNRLGLDIEIFNRNVAGNV
jgi:hypothetical protein